MQHNVESCNTFMSEYAILPDMATRKVIVALSLGGAAGRSCLSGIFDYVNAGHDWNIRLVQNTDELTQDFVETAIRNGTDGFLTGFRERTGGLRTLETASVPVVFTDYPRNASPDPARLNFLIRNDDLAIGREAAQHLLSRGTFRAYAFVPTCPSRRWSVLRERGFRLQLAESKIFPTTIPPTDNLAQALASLPKPTAVLAATDYMATQVLEACQTARLAVPEQVAVLGVDNDELLCGTARPTLSSVKPDHEGLGRIGAQVLDSLMARHRPLKRAPTHIRSLGVIERDSTRTVPPAGYLVREALAYIQTNAAKGIDVEDVARHLGVSRRLLYLRFRQMHGKAIHETILETRLALARERLVQTTEPLVRIAADCGFGSANRLSHLFAERFGLAPTRFRDKARAVTRG